MWWGAGGSVLVHCLVIVVLNFAPLEHAAEELLFSAEVDLSVAPDDEPEPELAEPDEAPTEASPDDPTPVRARARVRPVLGAVAPPVAGTLDILPEVVTPPSIGPVSPELTDAERERERARIAMVLSAERYARDSVIAGDPGPTRRGPPAGGGDAVGGLPPEVAMLTEAEAESAHSGHLRERAMDRPWLSHTPIVPVEQPDGSWVYSGPLFTARISPEGAVSFSDRDAVSYDLGSGTGGFDLTDMVMGGAGADPYASERERFMEETEELVARLEAAARAEHSSAAVRRIPGRLARVWGDDDLDAQARRRRIFDIWDEADDPLDGPAVRAAILRFIQDNLPQGSSDQYTPSEIAGLNATRESDEAFAPY